MNTKYDVAIIGCGTAGIFAGHELSLRHPELKIVTLELGDDIYSRSCPIVAGKVRGPDEAPRGAIRRELEGWLSHSPHAHRILALRNAHPRHGGAGSLYLLLKR